MFLMTGWFGCYSAMSVVSEMKFFACGSVVLNST